MNQRDREKLQRMIDAAVEANNHFFKAQTALHEWTRARYGVEAGDVDADEIIDGVFGANGAAGGMTADEYDVIMRRLS